LAAFDGKISQRLQGIDILRNLDAINPPIAKPQTFVSIQAILPFIMGATGLALADGAAPTVPFMENPLSVFSLCLLLLSVLLAPIPWLFKWGWQVKYFGVTCFHGGSCALMGWTPMLSIVLYGKLPPAISLAFLGFNIALTIWWCRRFVLFFRRIHDNQSLWNHLYVEEQDAVYYAQKYDKWLFEKKFKFAQIPSNFFCVSAILIAFSLVPFMNTVTRLVGVPFTHIFLAVGMVPINLIFLGMATKVFLIYCHYPWKIKCQTGKTVFIDMATPF
jgi:hypothetical protein